MRYLFVSAPLLGHLLPMVPLALSLRGAGHDVLVAAGGDALGVRESGLAVEDVAPNVHLGRIAGRILLRHPLIGRAEMTGTAGTRAVAPLFGKVNDAIIPAVVDLARRYQPDIVVYESLAVAGAVAAARLSVPAVLLENTLFDGPELVRVTARRLGGNIGGDLPVNAATLTTAPPSVVGPRDGWPMSGIPYAGLGQLPDWLSEPSDRPRILVTRSTVAGPGGGNLMPAVIAAAASVAADVILIRPNSRALRQTLPANVRTVDWIPVNRALPHCAAIVHHSGAGTIFGAFAAGVPQLAVPGIGDRRYNAELVAARVGQRCECRDGRHARPGGPHRPTRRAGQPGAGTGMRSRS